jgi:hypothetical protein
MSVPTEHLVALRRDVASHQQRIAQLRAAIRVAEEEIALHEVIIDLAQNDQLIAAVEELYDDSGLDSKFARDPQQRCQEEKIALPDGVTLNPIDTEGPSPRITARVRSGAGDMEIVWDRGVGFFARPALPPESPFVDVAVSAET